MKRTMTKMRSNPTVTRWRNIERGCTEDEWQGLENNLWKTFEEVLGFETKVSKREWFDTDSERGIGKMNEACKARLGRPTRKDILLMNNYVQSVIKCSQWKKTYKG